MMVIRKILDLSQPLYHNCPGFMEYEMTDVRYETIYPKHGYTSETIKMNSHTATHADAPFHFLPDGQTIDEVPVENYQGEAVPVDLFGIAPHTPIGVSHLKPYEQKIRPGDIVLLCTGWSAKRGLNSDYCAEWPFLSVEGAQWLLDKGVKGIGIDTLSMGGPGEGEGAPTHKLLLGHNIWLAEELNLTRELFTSERWYVSVYPLKLKGFSGAPARAVAMLID